MASGTNAVTTQLPYLRAGSGTVFVMVHGFLGGAEQWRKEIEQFSNCFDVIAPNLPGFGAAADMCGCQSITQMAEAVYRLLDELAIEKFVLLGHSMGGMVVQEMARMRPGRILGLVLYGTGPLGLMPDRFEPLTTSQERLRSEGVVATSRRIGSTWFKRGVEARGFSVVAELGALANPQAAAAALGAMGDWDGRAGLRQLDMPTLVVWGDADRSYRWPQVETLWTNLSDVRLSVIPGTAHAAHLEKSNLFHSLIRDFLSEIDITDAGEVAREI